MAIKWTEKDVIKAFDEAMNPPKTFPQNGQRRPEVLERLLLEAKGGGTKLPPQVKE